MAGLPGGGRGPGGVPKFVSAPATQPVGDSTTYIARGATVTPSWGAWRGWHAFADWIQQGIKTVAAPPQAPFAKYDWPNPQPGPLNRNLYGFIDYVSGLAPAVTAPSTNIIRTPTHTPTWRLVDRGQYQKWTDYYSIQIIPPPTNYDWPNPQAPRRSIELLTWKQSPAVPAAAVTPPPIRLYDWPVPRGAQRPIDLLTWIESPAVPPAVAAEPRVPVYTPRWSPYRIETLGFVQGLPTTLRPAGVVINPPIRLYDWPNPRGWPAPHVGFAAGQTLLQPPPPTRTSDCLLLLEDSSGNLILEDFLGLLALELCGPFVTYDLSLPPRALGPRQDWVQNAYAARNTAVVVTKPFLQTEWTNPRGPVSAHYGFGFGTNVGLLRPGVNPEINYDWPNPQPARRVVADWIQSAFAALQTSPPPPQPFNQIDWPVTLGRVGSHTGFTASTQLGLLRPDVNPFIPRDFANPKAPQRGVDLYGWIAALTALNLPVPVKPPIAQYDWPNPPAPVRGIDLWGWSQPVTALNLPPTPEPPPVVLQPGGRGVPHTFSRKRWRELQMLIAAEMAAVAKAEEVTKRGKREALLQAARAAAAAVDAAEAEGENKRLDKLLVRNALTLRAAIRAASEVKLLRETASAIEQSRAIVQRQQDEEDEMINLLMLS